MHYNTTLIFSHQCTGKNLSNEWKTKYDYERVYKYKNS